MTDLRTPAILSASTFICYVVSGLLAAFTLELASSVVQIVAYCTLALLISWLLLHYGNGSDDVISAIDGIANWLLAMVSIVHSNSSHLLCQCPVLVLCDSLL